MNKWRIFYVITRLVLVASGLFLALAAGAAWGMR
jgi:hypothetical protein